MKLTKEQKAQNAAAAKVVAEERRAKKLDIIAQRRAKSANLDKAQFIAEIVKGNFRPITAEDIAAEPNPD